jgi:hypothetical protein
MSEEKVEQKPRKSPQVLIRNNNGGPPDPKVLQGCLEYHRKNQAIVRNTNNKILRNDPTAR